MQVLPEFNEIGAVEGGVGATGDLDVLLRHRPASIRPTRGGGQPLCRPLSRASWCGATTRRLWKTPVRVQPSCGRRRDTVRRMVPPTRSRLRFGPGTSRSGAVHFPEGGVTVA